MSDTNTGSAPSPSPTPAPFQPDPLPTSAQEAAALYDALMHSPEHAEFRNAAVGDNARQQYLKNLYLIERGYPPVDSIPPPVNDTATLFERMDQRELREATEHRASLLRQGFSDKQAHEVQFGRPLTAAEKEDAENAYQAMTRDEVFMECVRRGDRQAKYQLRCAQVARKSPVGTLQQIAQWDAEFPYEE